MKVLLSLLFLYVPSSSSLIFNLSSINKLRREIAKAENLPMPDLIWNETLAEKAKTFGSDCDKIRHGPDYRYQLEGGDYNAKIMITAFYMILKDLSQLNNISLTDNQRIEMKKLKIDLENRSNEISFMFFEVINPAQTSLGCAHSTCTGVIPPEARELAKLLGATNNTYTFTTMCAVGPFNTWQKDKLHKVEHDVKLVNETGDVALDPGTSEEASGSTVLLQITLLLIIVIIIFAYFCSTRQVSRDPKLLEDYMVI